MKKTQLPKEILVQRACYGASDCFIASETPEEALEADLGKFEAGVCVGVYVLNRVVRIKARPPAMEDV